MNLSLSLNENRMETLFVLQTERASYLCLGSLTCSRSTMSVSGSQYNSELRAETVDERLHTETS